MRLEHSHVNTVGSSGLVYGTTVPSNHSGKNKSYVLLRDIFFLSFLGRPLFLLTLPFRKSRLLFDSKLYAFFLFCTSMLFLSLKYKIHVLYFVFHVYYVLYNKKFYEENSPYINLSH